MAKNGKTLEELYLNDNWVKEDAIPCLVQLVTTAENLKKLNISDSDMGGEGVLAVIRALKEN